MNECSYFKGDKKTLLISVYPLLMFVYCAECRCVIQTPCWTRPPQWRWWRFWKKIPWLEE